MQFIPHDGKSIPLPIETTVIMRTRGGVEHRTNVKDHDRWVWPCDLQKELPGDITGYFIPEKTK